MISNPFTKIYNIIQKKNKLKNLKILLYYFDSVVLLFSKRPKYKKEKRKKVLIVYNLALGDGVIFNCSARDYQKIYPKKEYEITFLCQNGVQNLYLDHSLFEHIVHLDFMKAAINPWYRIKVIKRIREVYYDIVVDPIGIFECTTNVLMTRVSVARKKIGIIDYNKEIYLPKKYISKIYDTTYSIEKDRILPLIEYYQEVIHLISEGKITHSVGFRKLDVLTPKIKIPKNYFVIFPSASIELKRWPIERYRELAHRIYEATKIPLVVCGTSIDQECVELLIEDLGIEVINLVGKTNLNDYFCIIKNAKFVVTNDTSAYHIAVVNETPVVIISGGYDFDRYIKYDFKRKNEFKKPYIVAKEKKCFNCNEFCPYFTKEDKTWKCLNEITVDMVWNKLKELFRDEGIGDKNEFRK